MKITRLIGTMLLFAGVLTLVTANSTTRRTRSEPEPVEPPASPPDIAPAEAGPVE